MEIVSRRACRRFVDEGWFSAFKFINFTHERLVSIEFSDRVAMKAGRVNRAVRVGSDHRLNQVER